MPEHFARLTGWASPLDALYTPPAMRFRMAVTAAAAAKAATKAAIDFKTFVDS